MNFVAHWPCLVERGESTVPALLRSCNYTKGLFTISVADNNASGLWDLSYIWLEQKICCGGRIPDNVWSNILHIGPSQVNQSVSISLSINDSLSENLGNAADPIPETAPLIETVSKKWCTLLMVDKIFAADLIRSDFHNHQTLNYAVFTWKSIKNHDAFTFTIEMGFTYVNIRFGWRASKLTYFCQCLFGAVDRFDHHKTCSTEYTDISIITSHFSAFAWGESAV